MKKYKVEPHFHTSEISECAHVPAREGIKIYKEHGYDTVIVTDHLRTDMTDFYSGSWSEKIDHWLTGYRAAKAAGDEFGITVLLGCEMAMNGTYNDMLIYGMDEAFLLAHEDIAGMNIADFVKDARDYGVLVTQAHPSRLGIRHVGHQYLEGVEVFNGNPRHDSHNDISWEYARRHNLLKIGGSDFHSPDDIGVAMLFDAPINSIADFTAALRRGEGEIIRLDGGSIYR